MQSIGTFALTAGEELLAERVANGLKASDRFCIPAREMSGKRRILVNMKIGMLLGASAIMNPDGENLVYTT